MKIIRRTSQFKKDVKRMEKRGKDFTGFKEAVKLLADGQIIDVKYRDHPLVGQYTGTRECHIEPDWLLIYESTEDEIVLIDKVTLNKNTLHSLILLAYLNNWI